MRRRRAPILLVLAALACWWSLAGPAEAHTGGPLDDDGCHGDRRRGNFHCHRGPARGYEFRSRAAMKEAVESGNLAERPADTEGFLRKLWPFGKPQETSREPPSPPLPVEAGAAVLSPIPTVAPSVNAADAGTTSVATPATAPSAPAVAPPTQEAAPPPEKAAPRAIETPPPSTPPARVPASPLPPPSTEPAAVDRSVRSYEERLRTLEGLRERGVITGEEYEARRKAILDEI